MILPRTSQIIRRCLDSLARVEAAAYDSFSREQRKYFDAAMEQHHREAADAYAAYRKEEGADDC
jgi:hypothetical protein